MRGRASIVCDAGIILPLVPRYMMLWGGGNEDFITLPGRDTNYSLPEWTRGILRPPRALHWFWVDSSLYEWIPDQGPAAQPSLWTSFHCLLPNSYHLPLAPLSPACHLLNSGSHWSSWSLSYCSLGRVCLQVVMVATSGPAQSLPAHKGRCTVLEHCCFILVRFCWFKYSSLIESPVQPAHILCVSVHTACLLPKVNSCPRKSTGKVQRVTAKEISRLVSRCIQKDHEQTLLWLRRWVPTDIFLRNLEVHLSF